MVTRGIRASRQEEIKGLDLPEQGMEVYRGLEVLPPVAGEAALKGNRLRRNKDLTIRQYSRNMKPSPYIVSGTGISGRD